MTSADEAPPVVRKNLLTQGYLPIAEICCNYF
jgi:hypothetical protein